MRRRLPLVLLTFPSVVVFLALAALLAAAPVAAQTATSADWQSVAPPEPAVVAGVQESVWQSSRPPGGEFDVIRLHRYRAAGNRAAGNTDQVAPIATLLYLPGTNMNGSLPRDAVELLDANHNLWLWLAERGVDVYALDYRTHAVPADYEGELDFMASWTAEAFVDDARSALGLIEEQVRQGGRDPDAERIVVAGFSRGVSYAYALACVAEQIDGVVALDGSFKSVDSLAAGAARTVGQLETELEEARQKSLASGRFASDVAAGIGWQPRDQLMRSTMSNPVGPASDDKYDTIGDQLAELLYQAWRPGGLAHPIGASSGRGISRPEVLAALLRDYDRFFPSIQDVDGRLIPQVGDHPAVAMDDCFGKSDDPVIWFGATGMGAPWLLDSMFSATRFGKTPKVEAHVLEGYGHLDVLVSESAREDVYEPLLAWLTRQ